MSIELVQLGYKKTDERGEEVRKEHVDSLENINELLESIEDGTMDEPSLEELMVGMDGTIGVESIMRSASK